MNKELLLIDAHAHIQECYNIKDYFLSTFKNFFNVADSKNINGNWTGVLFLTEVKGVNYFKKLKSLEINESLQEGNISISDTLENNSIILTNEHGQKIVVIAGQQIICENNIEVLALGTIAKFDYGNTLESTVEQIQEDDAIPILPWGVGKWLGKRNEILVKFITENDFRNFFLGDNSGRPIFWSSPKTFKIGIDTGHFLLPGSDALAIPSEYNKTGRYGFYLESEINFEKPTECIKSSILKMNKQPSSFGQLESPFKFLSNQIKMQLRKHIK